MNWLGTSKKVLLFGLFGAIGCLAGWAVGEGYLYAAREAVGDDAGEGPSLISKSKDGTNAQPPSNEFKERLKREGANTGDVQISLIWFDKNDLDLHCVGPDRVQIFYKNRFSPSGGHLDVDANGDRGVPITSEPVENIYWPEDGAPGGRYRVSINFFKHNPELGGPRESRYKVSVLAEGKRTEYTGEIETNGTNENRRDICDFQIYAKAGVIAPREIQLQQGTELKVPFKIRRINYQGEVKVTAENLPEGVTVEPAIIPKGKTEDGTILLKASRSADVNKTSIKIVAQGGEVNGAFDAELSVTAPKFSVTSVILIGIWTALLAVGLCLALLMGQNRYLKRPLLGGRPGLLVGLIFGAIAAGFVSGSVGQALYSVFISIGVGSIGFMLGWVLLGGLLGLGVSYFVPNLDKKKAMLAGLGGGLLGAIAYLVWSNAADWMGRFAGAAALGFCIGLVVAIVEAAFRRAWLEVRFGERETIQINLGPEPVKVGGDAKLCTVWARGAADVAYRYFIRNGQVICEDARTRAESIVGHGDVRTAGIVTLTVHTSGAPVAANSGLTPTARPAAPPPLPLPAAPAPVVVPVPQPVPGNREFTLPVNSVPPPAARPEPPKPVPVPVPPPPPQPAPKPAVPDYDDGLPVSSKPPSARSKAVSILDDGGFLPSPRPATAKPPAPAPKASAPAAPPKPVAPPAATPAPPAAKLPAPPTAAATGGLTPPARPEPPKPPVPAPAAVKPPIPPAKPPAPSAPPKPASPPPATPASAATPATDADACPTCKRKNPGKPGARFCMLCDKTY